MYSVLHTLSEYTYFFISKNIISYTFLLVFKIVESIQCILNVTGVSLQQSILLWIQKKASIMAGMKNNAVTWHVVIMLTYLVLTLRKLTEIFVLLKNLVLEVIRLCFLIFSNVYRSMLQRHFVKINLNKRTALTTDKLWVKSI